ncbi:cbb3-type cytochrome oxidase subunit 3 [Rheinheimera sp. WS51]|uniref:cbb3-type cytochrome oxidase subunit 3 n=1 Tax=Rheinheimera sp. WS51 TaxID=3425886 RepID=UPI003D910052
MTYADIHSIYTVILFVAFVSFVFWTFVLKRKKDFDQAANLVFGDELKKQQQETKQESDHE